MSNNQASQLYPNYIEKIMNPTHLTSKGIKDLKLGTKLNLRMNKAFLNTVRYNKLSLMQDFIDLGVDVNAKGPYGQTALMIAALKGNTEAVTLLLASPRIQVNEQAKNGATALMIAASKGYLEIVKALLGTEGIDVNLTSENGLTGLMLAVKHGHTKVVKALLAFPATISNLSTHTSAMDLAIQYNRSNIIFLLLNHVDQPAIQPAQNQNVIILAPPSKTVILSTVQTPVPPPPTQTDLTHQEKYDTSLLRFALQKFNPYKKL
jgi:ankyrin repeat protein